jgi:hypothetical protein
MENLQAVASLAPTHQTPRAGVRLEKDVPYLVVYGSRDYDTSGLYSHDSGNADLRKMASGFTLYDRAYDQEKSMIYMQRATHNGFITSNADDIRLAQNQYGLVVNPADLLDDEVQFSASKAYFNGWFRKHLYEESFWSPYYTGENFPESVQSDRIIVQYEPKSTSSRLFTDPSYLPRGGAVGGLGVYSGDPADIVTGDLRDGYGFDLLTLQGTGASPCYSSGVFVDWEAGSEVTYTAALAQDVTTYQYVSFRIANANRGADLRGVRVGLTSGAVTQYIEIDPILAPDIRTDEFQILSGMLLNIDPSKNTMKTIRVPLADFVTLGIDLLNVTVVRVRFPGVNGGLESGEVNIDNVQFTDLI